MAEYISERAAAQVIADSVRIYLKHLPVIFAIYGLPILPFIALEAMAISEGDEGLHLTAVLIQAVISVFTLGAVSFAVSDVCLGNQPSIKRSYGAIGRVFWAYLGTYLIYVVATLAGLILLVVPGIAAMLLLLFCLPAAIIERRSPVASCRRSIQLGKGYYWRNFGIVLLAMLFATLVMFVIGFLMGVSTVFGFDPDGFSFNFALALLTSLAAPLYQIPAILLYYDMRVRKEHFDSAALAQDLMT